MKRSLALLCHFTSFAERQMLVSPSLSGFSWLVRVQSSGRHAAALILKYAASKTRSYCHHRHFQSCAAELFYSHFTYHIQKAGGVNNVQRQQVSVDQHVRNVLKDSRVKGQSPCRTHEELNDSTILGWTKKESLCKTTRLNLRRNPLLVTLMKKSMLLPTAPKMQRTINLRVKAKNQKWKAKHFTFQPPVRASMTTTRLRPETFPSPGWGNKMQIQTAYQVCQ